MAHRCEHLCSTSQLWLPHPALCVVLPECFWGLCVWSRAMGSKSGKLWNVADHDTYFQEAHKLNCHQAQWSLYLSRFDFVLTHKPGRQMGRPDALSRQVDHPRGVDDNMDFTLLTPEVFELRVTEAFTLEGEEAIFMERI